jgi:ribonuclease HI
LSTHAAGDVVTDKDKAFAKRVDALTAKPKETTGTALPKHVKLYGDGGSRGNPGPSASGFVILDMDDNVLFEQGVYLGITTNNQAEYQALKFGLEKALQSGVREIEVHMDSLLVINQLKGIFKVKNRDLWPIYAAIVELAKEFKHISYTHVPRELNKLADAQVNICLDAQN